MYGEPKVYMVEYEMIWANKIVETDILDTEAIDKYHAERNIKNQIQSKNKKAIINIINSVET